MQLSSPSKPTINRFEPPHPTLSAVALSTLWIAIISLPMWQGKFLAGPLSDQYATGYAWRHWQAVQWKALGHIPLWDPNIFGGLPYVAGMHGDIFYPTAWLRLFLPTAFAMDLGFVVHYVLAGLFTYLLLRRLKVSWVGSMVGGLSYQLSGVIASYVQPGHDGKLFVTALLPLAFLALLMAIRDRKLEGYALLALAMGLALLSPHPQMTQYFMIASALFGLYLTFGEATDRPVSSRVTALSLALGAVVVGFMIGAIQMLPFYQYIPFSPRAESFRGWEGATSYAIPWIHVPEFFLAKFVGQTGAGTYWGSNPIKLHSEYLGLPVIMLAVLGVGVARRRLIYWLGGIGILFLLVALGANTPFYRLWYEVVPFVKQTRAPGMALYIVALLLSLFAAFGVERLESGEGRKQLTVWLVVAGVLTLLAVIGAFGGMATSLARGVQQATNRPAISIATQAASVIRWSTVGSTVALGLAAGVGIAALNGRMKPAVFGLSLILIVSGDLWRNAREFWVFSNAEDLHGPDQVTQLLSAVPKPYRALNLSSDYPGSSLMTHDIPQLLGHHGTELHRFDELMGGQDRLSNRMNPNIWDLYSVQYMILPSQVDLSRIPGFEQSYRVVLEQVETAAGGRVSLFEAIEARRYGRLVPTAVKVPDEQAIPVISNPRFSVGQAVLLGPEAPLDPSPPTELPEPLDNRVRFEEWEPGKMSIRLEPPAPQDAYLVVSENWYKDWKATVDGVQVPVVRGNVSLITVPVPKGAEKVELRFESGDYSVGRTVTLFGLLIVGVGLVLPGVMRRRAA